MGALFPALAQGPAMTRYIGVLPCDCAGIRTEIRLYSDSRGNAEKFESIETSLGTPDGGRTSRRSGKWTSSVEPIPQNPSAIVFLLKEDHPDSERYFLRVDDMRLRLLDSNLREITLQGPHTLYRVADDQSSDPVIVTGADAGKPIRAVLGQTIVFQLNENRSTGYRWNLQPGNVSITFLGDSYAVSAERVQPGEGGTATWTFVATQSGKEDVRFDNRRSGDPAPANTLTYTVDVR